MRATKFLLLLIVTVLLLAACGGAATIAVADTPTASSSEPDGLTISCSLNDATRQVTCEASGYVEGSRLYWWTNWEQAKAEGETFAFAIMNPRPDLNVSFETCKGGNVEALLQRVPVSCQTVTTTLDTAHLTPPKPATTISPIAKPSPSPPVTAAPTEPPTPTAQATSSRTEGQPTPGNNNNQSGASVSTATESIYDTDLTVCSNTINGFDSSPVPLEKVVSIEPMGKIGGSSGHIMPTDHLYINVISSGPESVPVLAIADGHLVKIQRMPDREGRPDLRAIIEHSCSLFSWYIHLDNFSETILRQITIRDNGVWIGRIPVKSGETVGYVGELLSYQQPFGKDQFDFAVSDTEKVLKGFIVPAHYQSEAWKIHIVDPFDYYDDPLRSELAKKSLRADGPAGGRIDYDVDGRLVGNWFIEGTRDYAASGLAEAGESEWARILGRESGDCTIPYWDNIEKRVDGNTPCAFWLGHAVFAYDHLEPDRVLISIGLHYDGEGGIQAPWAVVGNGPDPAQVGVESGEIKYELIDPQMQSENNATPQGTLLVMMIDKRSIQTELFVGIRPDMVKGFTERARIYLR